MKIVTDTNRLIAVIIKDGASRSILRNPKHEFYTPDFAIEEILKYKNEIKEKSGLSEEEFIVFLFLLFHRVILISSERYDRKMAEAIQIIGHIDRDDVPFIACALELDAFVWSDDPHFTKQGEIRIFKTADLLE